MIHLVYSNFSLGEKEYFILAISYYLIFFLIQMNPLKKKPKTMVIWICTFKASNVLELFWFLFFCQRNIKFFLTTMNIFFMFFQGILTLEPLPAAICLAYESGIPSACLLVLFITIWDNQQIKTTHEAVYAETRHIVSTLSSRHAALQSSKATSCITYSK